MKYHKVASILVFTSLLILSLSACRGSSSGPIDPNRHEPGITPSPDYSGEEWLYVALGDSEALCCGQRTYPEFYATFMKEDLGVRVTLNNLAVYGSTSQELLDLLEEENVQALLKEARVVTIVTTLNDLLRCEMRDRDCIQDQMAIAMENYQQIIDKVVSLTPPGRTIIRTQNYDNPLVGNWKSLGIFEERNEMFMQWNQNLVAIANRNNLPIADVYLDFNGPLGDEDVAEKGYLAFDQFHNNEAGAQRIAELLRALGYAPYLP